jgi:hypothetical protein
METEWVRESKMIRRVDQIKAGWQHRAVTISRIPNAAMKTGEIRSFTVHLRQSRVPLANGEKSGMNSGQKLPSMVVKVDRRVKKNRRPSFRWHRWPILRQIDRLSGTVSKQRVPPWV